jgi:hypothetical protein
VRWAWFLRRRNVRVGIIFRGPSSSEKLPDLPEGLAESYAYEEIHERIPSYGKCYHLQINVRLRPPGFPVLVTVISPGAVTDPLLLVSACSNEK